MATDEGTVRLGTPVGRLPAPSVLTPDAEGRLKSADLGPATSLHPHPLFPDVVVAGFAFGGMCAFHSSSRKPLRRWEDATGGSGAAVLAARWSAVRASLVFVLDSYGTLRLFDVLREGDEPLHEERVRLAFCAQASVHQRGRPGGDGERGGAARFTTHPHTSNSRGAGDTRGRRGGSADGDGGVRAAHLPRRERAETARGHHIQGALLSVGQPWRRFAAHLFAPSWQRCLAPAPDDCPRGASRAPVQSGAVSVHVVDSKVDLLGPDDFLRLDAALKSPYKKS